MPLSLLQQYEVLHEVRRLHAELNNVVSQLDRLADLRARYGDDVVTFLAGVITVAEWQASSRWQSGRTREAGWYRGAICSGKEYRQKWATD